MNELPGPNSHGNQAADCGDTVPNREHDRLDKASQCNRGGEQGQDGERGCRADLATINIQEFKEVFGINLRDASFRLCDGVELIRA